MRRPNRVLAAGIAVGTVWAAPAPAQETAAGADCPNAIAAFVERLRASGRWPAIETALPDMEERLVAALGAPAARCRATLRRERERVAAAGFTRPDGTRGAGEGDSATAMEVTVGASASETHMGEAADGKGPDAADGAEDSPPAADDEARMAGGGTPPAAEESPDGGPDDGIAPHGAIPRALRAPAPADPGLRAPGPDDVPLPEDTASGERAPAARNGADAPESATAADPPGGAAIPERTADAAATAMRPAPEADGAEPRDPVWSAPRPAPAAHADDSAGRTALAPVAVRAVAFGFDSARVSRSARRDVLADVVEIARRRPEATVLLTGYASPAGDAAYNRALSRERVAAVTDALTAMGLPAERIRGRAFGERTPRATPGEARRMPESRRVEIRVLAPRAG